MTLVNLSSRCKQAAFGELGSLARRGGLLVVGAAAAQSLGNLVFHGVISRVVGPTDYGALATLLAIMLAAAVPLASVQLAVTRAVVEAGRDGDHRRLLVRAVRASVAVALLGMAAAPVIQSFLRLSDLALAAMVGPYGGLALVGAVSRGMLAARGRAGVIAASLGVATATRLLVGLTFVGDFGIAGAAAATVAGELAGAIVALIPLRKSMGSVPVRLPLRDIAGTVAAIAGLWLFANADLLMARRLLDAVDAGLYVAAGNAARALLIIPQAVLIVALPRFVPRRGDTDAARPAPVVGALALVGILTGGVGMFLIAADSWALTVLYGRGFVSAAPLLAPFAAVTVAVALSTVCAHREMARRSHAALLPWAGAAVALGLVACFHSNGVQIARMMVAASLAYTVGAVGVTLLRRQRERARPAVVVGDLYAPGGPSVELSIIVPFLDRTRRSAQNVLQLVDVLSTRLGSFEVIAVSDGSPEEATRPLTNVDSGGRLRLLRLPYNCGKGAAVRFGMSQARGRYIGFVDSDGDIPFGQVLSYYEAMRAFSADIVYGSKRHPLSVTLRSRLRSVASSGFRLLTRVALALPVRDTQCGLKIVDGAVARAVLPWLAETGFSFDVELFAVARRLGYGRFLKAPITVIGRGGSTVRASTALRMALDVLRIARRVRRIRPVRPDRSLEGAATPLPSSLREAVAAARIPPLRILVLSWRDPRHPAAGGSEVYLAEVGRSWAAWGHEITWFSAAAEGLPSEEHRDGIRFVRRGGRFTVYREAKRFWREHNTGYDLVLDVINTRPFAAPSYVKGVPVVALAHQVAREVWFHEMPWPVAALGAFLLEPLWLRRYKRVPTLTVSASSRRSLAAYGLQRLRVVPEGVNRPRIPALPPKADRPTLVFCGRLVRSKRPEDALRAFAVVRERVPTAELLVIGTGPEEDRLRRMAPAGVRFLGRVPESVKYDVMARAHALVITSVREGWGLVVSEAASVGTRTVAYDVDGLRDSVAAAGGVLCSPDPASLADAVLAVLSRWKGRPADVDPYGGAMAWPSVAAEVLAAAVFEGDVFVDLEHTALAGSPALRVVGETHLPPLVTRASR